MESQTTQREITLNSPPSLRPKYTQSSQLSVGPLSDILSHKRIDGSALGIFSFEPSYSSISSRCGSSFSSESSTESWGLISSHPSPETPRSKHELEDDIPQLDLVPRHGDVLKRKCDSPEGGGKKMRLSTVQLPSFHDLLSHSGNKDHHEKVSRTPIPSPELSSSEYKLAGKANVQSSEDPIIQWLNLRRMESKSAKPLLSQPRELGNSSVNVHLDIGSPPVFYREKQQHHTPQHRGHYHRQLSPPKDIVKRVRAKGGKPFHNNIKYTIEETDYIRFNKYEMKLSWEENKILFRQKFPMADRKLDREKQGIQGVHYRDNLHVPHLQGKGRRLVFLDNGHIEAVTVKVRRQRENKSYFSLTYLYPERALLYDWVPPKFKQIAAELGEFVSLFPLKPSPPRVFGGVI